MKISRGKKINCEERQIHGMNSKWFSIHARLSLSLSLSHLFVRELSLSLAVVQKNKFAFKTRVFSITKYIFLPHSCHTHKFSLSHSLTHYLRLSALELWTEHRASICHFDQQQQNWQWEGQESRCEWTKLCLNASESQAQVWISKRTYVVLFQNGMVLHP